MLCLFLIPVLLAADAPQTPLTPAQAEIQNAEREVEKQPSYFGSYNDLARALVLRERETLQPDYLTSAEQALKKSFALSPNNFEGEKTQAFLWLERREDQKALDLATKLHQQTPDDLIVRGYMADAHFGLGDYEASLDDAQGILNLRIGNAAGMAKGAQLREVFGDIPGAIEMARTALNATDPSELEPRAFLLCLLSHLCLLNGDLTSAEAYATEATQLFPSYPRSLMAFANVRMAQKRYGEAVVYRRQLCAAVARASNRYYLAVALERAGSGSDATKTYAEFERQALSESDLADNANLELATYYLAGGNQPRKGLSLAAKEYAIRHDLKTTDCYAWALYKNGRRQDAIGVMQKAVASGTKDPDVLEHAKRINQQEKSVSGGTY